MLPHALKHIERSKWIDSARDEPTLTILSVVDDRSDITCQEYRKVAPFRTVKEAYETL